MGRRKDDDDDDYDRGMDMGEKLSAPPDFDGPIHNRKCTDVLCSLLLVISWGLMSFLGYYSLTNGDYRIVLFPLDYDGNICGTTYAKDFTEYPFIYTINNFGGGVCVKECPSLQNVTSDDASDVRSFITYDGFWQADGAELNSTFVQVANYSDSEDKLTCDEELCFPSDDPKDSYNATGISRGKGFAYYVADTYPVLNYCVFTLDSLLKIQNQTASDASQPEGISSYEFWNKLYADLWEASLYILGFGFGLSLVVSFSYVMILRLPFLLNMVVWLSLFIAIGIFFVAGGYAYLKAQEWADLDPPIYDENTINATRIGSFVLIGIGCFLLLMLCCLRKQIHLAIGCVKETGRALARMPLIVLVPVLQAFGFIVFMGAFCLYAVHLASLGEISVREIPLDLSRELTMTVRTYTFDEFIERAAWYLLFCLFWTGNFIVAVGDMVIAMSIAKWYFTWDKKETSSVMVISSVYDTMFYHLGTCAYGSLILAIVQIIRAILAKVQKEMKKANNKIADALLCCCQCCLWCFEKCIKFLNKNAYIQTAIFGTSFCKSAREAFFLILRNAGRIGAITVVSSVVLMVGKLFISSLTTAAAYYFLVEYLSEDLNSVAGPVILIFIMSYFISDMFMDVFDMGISAILQCFVADEEMFDGDDCYAEGELQKWIDNYEDD